MTEVNYLILEDEQYACEELVRMMRILRPNYLLQECADSVARALSFLKDNKPDLMIVDIQLSDGLCFDVFEKMSIQTPVIFTTAYDEYALQAFRVNSIDYLLKPIEECDLERALKKFETNTLLKPTSHSYFNLMTSYLNNVKRNRFLVTVGDSLYHIEISEIAFFYCEEKYVFLHTFSEKRYIINYTLEQLENMLDRQSFFRVSRNCITHIKAIKKVSRYFGGRLLISFQPVCPQKIIVSRGRVGDFIKWMDGIQ